MSRSIKSYVEECARDGMSVEQIYESTASALPGRHISWNYVVGLRRRFLAGQKGDKPSPERNEVRNP